MKLTRDPVRLADLGDDAAFDFGSAIRALRAQTGSAAEVAALGRRLGAQLAAPTTAGIAGTALGLWVKWGASLVLALAIGFYVTWLRFASTASQPSPTPVRMPEAQAPSSPIEHPTRQAAAAKPSEPLHTPPATAAHRRPRVEHAVTPPPAAPAPDPQDELALLKRAQAALDRDPTSALALAEQHGRAYPRGAFAQEREILALEALLKLKQKSAALARAQAFVQRYPDSPHTRRVRSLLERSHLNAIETIAPASDHPREGNQH